MNISLTLLLILLTTFFGSILGTICVKGLDFLFNRIIDKGFDNEKNSETTN